MSATNELAKIYDTVLSIPGMNDPVKIELRIPRKDAFLLAKVIERGLSPKDGESINGLLAAMNVEAMETLKVVPDELLKKAGLTDLNEKLKALK